jgi:hypothetical protein
MKNLVDMNVEQKIFLDIILIILIFIQKSVRLNNYLLILNIYFLATRQKSENVNDTNLISSKYFILKIKFIYLK